MQSGQFTRQIETDTVTRCSGGTRAVMEPFEDVFARRNRTASVSYCQHYLSAVATCANPNSPAGTIVLSRVLQKILHDEGCVAFLTCDKKPAWKLPFNFHIWRFRQCAKIIQPFINQLTEIHGC